MDYIFRHAEGCGMLFRCHTAEISELLPQNLTWNLKSWWFPKPESPNFQGLLFRFHVKFRKGGKEGRLLGLLGWKVRGVFVGVGWGLLGLGCDFFDSCKLDDGCMYGEGWSWSYNFLEAVLVIAGLVLVGRGRLISRELFFLKSFGQEIAGLRILANSGCKYLSRVRDILKFCQWILYLAFIDLIAAITFWMDYLKVCWRLLAIPMSYCWNLGFAISIPIHPVIPPEVWCLDGMF